MVICILLLIDFCYRYTANDIDLNRNFPDLFGGEPEADREPETQVKWNVQKYVFFVWDGLNLALIVVQSVSAQICYPLKSLHPFVRNVSTVI